MNKKANKRLATFLLIFALVFITGGAYAATNGVLTFDGTANLNPGSTVDKLLLELSVKVGNENAVSADDNSTGNVVISEDKQTAIFTADLEKPGSQVTFTLDCENVGTLDAFIWDFSAQLQSHDNLEDILEFGGSYETDMQGEIIESGDKVEDFTFSIKWKEGAEDYAGEQIMFELTNAYDML